MRTFAIAVGLIWAVCAGGAAAAQKGSEPAPLLKGLAPGWTGLVDPSGRCRFSVPARWQILDAERMAFAPDGIVSAAEEWAPSPSWAWYKMKLYRLVRPTLQHEDSDQRIWLEYLAGWEGAHHFAAVPSADGVCALQIDVRAGGAGAAAEIVRQIIGSLVALPPS